MLNQTRMPTPRTATEGFRDYVAAAPEDERALMHASARYELEAMHQNRPGDSQVESAPSQVPDPRLFSLAYWPRRYFSATVDQFLAFLEHRYASLCLLPALADCALVIDEVHSFGPRMFNALVAFLREFDLPVLCMTATLPPQRQRKLVELGLRVYPDSGEQEALRDLEEQAAHPRYRLRLLSDRETALERAAAAFGDGLRVLWVANVVRRAQECADLLAQQTGQDVLCYHSRYKLEDRQATHRCAVDAFGDKNRPALVVATQVCEMSLDIDADVLITELAPIPSMVQRFGRANRHRVRGDGFRAELIVIPPESEIPYDREEMIPVRGFCEVLDSQVFSQHALAEMLEKHCPKAREPEGAASFPTSGWFATERDFRDAGNFTVPCVLDSDITEVIAALKEKIPWDGYVVPVPRSAARPPNDVPRNWPRYLQIASSTYYTRDRGFATSVRGAP